MNNPNENQTPALIIPAVTAANVDRLMSYVRKNDREGAIGFGDCLRDCETLADVHGVLHGVLLTRFQVDIIENSGTSYNPIETENLEDREQAIETLHRYGFGSSHFDSAFPSVMAYALRNVSPQE
jgi:hypothetical protein